MMETAAKTQVFSPRVALALVAIGALSLLCFVVFAAYAPEAGGEYDGRPHALSRSALGFAGLVAFLRADGVPVTVSRGSNDSQYAPASLVVVTPWVAHNIAQLAGAAQA